MEGGIGDKEAFRNLATNMREVATVEDQLLYRNAQQFRGGLVSKALSLLNHSTLGSKVIKKRRRCGKQTAWRLT